MAKKEVKRCKDCYWLYPKALNGNWFSCLLPEKHNRVITKENSFICKHFKPKLKR